MKETNITYAHEKGEPRTVTVRIEDKLEEILNKLVVMTDRDRGGVIRMLLREAGRNLDKYEDK